MTLGASALLNGAFFVHDPLQWRAMQGNPQGLAVCQVHGIPTSVSFATISVGRAVANSSLLTWSP